MLTPSSHVIVGAGQMTGRQVIVHGGATTVVLEPLIPEGPWIPCIPALPVGPVAPVFPTAPTAPWGPILIGVKY